MTHFAKPRIFVLAMALLMLAACSSNNCPLNNTVLCNYQFYDSQGKAIKYNDAITVKTLKPGHKTVYVYRKLGEQTVTYDYPMPSLTEQGFTESTIEQRRDTVLINNVSGKSLLQVPMSYFNDADTLVLSYSSISRNDTIYIRHESFAHVEQPECGTHFFHHLKDVRATDAAIDHVEIVNSLVDYEGKENIKIYFNGTVE